MIPGIRIWSPRKVNTLVLLPEECGAGNQIIHNVRELPPYLLIDRIRFHILRLFRIEQKQICIILPFSAVHPYIACIGPVLIPLIIFQKACHLQVSNQVSSMLSQALDAKRIILRINIIPQ